MDSVSKEARSRIMRAIRSKDTGIEMQLRKALWGKGLRYRVHYGPERIDIAFPRRKIAVFVDGCFWHGCPIHQSIPKTNVKYWNNKISENVRRDIRKKGELEHDGWTVFRIWEHELDEPEKVANKIIAAVNLHE